jgi:hypothetical protein
MKIQNKERRTSTVTRTPQTASTSAHRRALTPRKEEKDTTNEVFVSESVVIIHHRTASIERAHHSARLTELPTPLTIRWLVSGRT